MSNGSGLTAVAMSGGVDSSVAAALLARLPEVVERVRAGLADRSRSRA